MSITIRPLKALGDGTYLWQSEDVDVNAMNNNDILAFDTSIAGIESNGVTGAWVNKALTLNGAGNLVPTTTAGGLMITHTGGLAYTLDVDNTVIRTSTSGGTQSIGGNLNVTGNMVVTGDMTVNGTTTITTRDISTGESIIVLNALMSPTDPPVSTGGGIYVYRGNSTFTTGIIWDEISKVWSIDNRTGVDPTNANFPTQGGGTSTARHTIWHSGNMGGNSGLNADLLDGQDGLFYQTATNLISGIVPVARLSGTYNINISGNAVTATKLQAPVNINGVPFDGSQNITVADSTKLPLSGGVMTGNYSQDMIPGVQGITVIKRPVAFTADTPSNTGTIKIVLPVGWTNTMMRLRIIGYEYASSCGAWEMILGGYNYSTTPGWNNFNVICSGDSPFTSVRLAYDSSVGKMCILLGTTSTVLAYPKIVVEDVMIGYSGVSSATWRTGWSIAQITNESALTNIVTPAFKNISDFGYTVAGSADAATARTALGVYSTSETYSKAETYTKAEVNALLATVARDAMPLFSVQWWPSRSAIPVGFISADGQLLGRTTYPDAWAGIAAGKVPSTDDGTWTSTQVYRGMYTSGNNSTTFRIPDYNGVTGGSLGAAFLRGDGLNSAGTKGVIQVDDVRSHTHLFNTASRFSTDDSPTNGAVNYIQGDPSPGTTQAMGAGFNSQNYIAGSGGAETRPVNVTGCWVIKIQGTSTTYSVPFPEAYEPYVPPEEQCINNASVISAQVKFNGVTTDILNSHNISSVANLGTGRYRIRFIDMDTDAYYVSPTLTGMQYMAVLVSDATVDGFTIDVVNNDSEHIDVNAINIIVIGGNNVN